MPDYKTLRGTSTFTYEEKRSRFIATAAFADTEEKALAVLNAVRVANRTARHNVYAYVLQNGRTRYSDDGEPAKTAGTPVLETIGHAGVSDVIVVVTRYFGGILLGTGGLVRAYTAAAGGALQNAELVSMRLVVDCRLRVPYAQFEQAQRIIAAAGAKPEEPVFDDAVTLLWRMPAGEEGPLCAKLTGTDPRQRRSHRFGSDVRTVLILLRLFRAWIPLRLFGRADARHRPGRRAAAAGDARHRPCQPSCKVVL